MRQTKVILSHILARAPRLVKKEERKEEEEEEEEEEEKFKIKVCLCLVTMGNWILKPW